MRFYKFPIIITIIITFILIFINHFLDGSYWKNWELVPNIVNGCFCEHNYMERFIRQPFNTWSNLAFLFFGIAILQQSLKSESESGSENRKNNYLRRQPIIGLCFSILLFILFIH